MQYRIDPRTGNKLSILGMGCMRLPRNLAQIDQKKSETLVLDAVEKGINYFDAAYSYSGSEETLGTILDKNGIRDKVYIATKLPIAKCNSREDFETLFQTQLKWLKTDHVDYYLMHNIPKMNVWKRLCGLGIEQWIAEKKASGAIGQVGFSFHGMQSEFMELISAYDWEFCQIQYNYMNVNFQAGEAGLKKAAEKGLPVIVMEPLLGGKLARALPKTAQEIFKKADPGLNPVGWALRWLWDQPEVTVVLSGMNESAQLVENVGLAEDASENIFTEKEKDVIARVTEVINSAYRIPCTGCNYCMPCPKGVNIPGAFSAHNTSYVMGLVAGYQQYLTGVAGLSEAVDNSPKHCAKCGKCESLCPQNIAIIKSLEAVKRHMEPFWFGPMKAVVGMVMGR